MRKLIAAFLAGVAAATGTAYAAGTDRHWTSGDIFCGGSLASGGTILCGVKSPDGDGYRNRGYGVAMDRDFVSITRMTDGHIVVYRAQP
jgi:hypothetical protein